MASVKIGIIGAGVIGKAHAKAAAASEYCELAAIADLNKEAAQAVADEYGVSKVYGSSDELLADPDVEGVVLAMPAFVRTPIALAAFKAGKHVLNEKPIAMNTAEVEEMIAAKGDLTAASCSSRMHYLKSTQKAAEIISSGALGDLRVIRVRGLKPVSDPPTKPPVPWRYRIRENAGGIMSNWGCYDLDYVLGITGWKLKPVSVSAQTWTIAPELENRIAPDSDAETHLLAIVKCEGGTAIVIERGEQITRPEDEAWEVTGTKAGLRLVMPPGEEMFIKMDSCSTESGLSSEIVWQGSGDWDDALGGPVEDFAQAILDKKEPKTTLEKALIIRKITDGIYESSKTGREIKL